MLRLITCQGWTKFTKFGDLDAMSEAEWDKVALKSSIEANPNNSTVSVGL